MNKTYLCIDLKSFYASVECRERGLDPLTTNLVVADPSRTEKTICLAVTPSLKEYGLSGRSRLYEVVQKVNEVNRLRRKNNNYKKFINKSYNSLELKRNKNLELDYITAPPRMKLYMKYSTDIYNIYLKYVSCDDIYVYSIDEAFFDVTNYLKLYNKTPEELATTIVHDVYETTGITATAGIGTNMYLCKIAMDILAKHKPADDKGVRIASLDEATYRKELWGHTPITDFWRVGKGYKTRLEKYKIYTMGDVARTSLNNQELLYKLFGVNAEILIDHAWGYEPVTMKDVKSFKPSINSLSTGQVLHEPYDYNKTKLIVKEMMELLSLDLVLKNVVTNQLVLTIGYDISNINSNYEGEITTDHYGRAVPKHAHGTINLDHYTASTKLLLDNIIKLYERIINKNLLVRRINIVACNIINKNKIKENKIIKQLDLFSQAEENTNIKQEEQREERLQKTMLDIKMKYGKNAILKGMNLSEGATTIDRNKQVGGHNG